jgi:hypothetical protein
MFFIYLLGVAGKLPIPKKWGDFFGQISVEIFFYTRTCVNFATLAHTCSSVRIYTNMMAV